MLKVENLVVNYGQTQAVRSISFSVDEHNVVCLIGSNGAGKTTTLLAISGIVAPQSGCITFRGQNVLEVPAHQIAGLGLAHVPEGRHVFPALTVEENLLTGKSPCYGISKSETEDRLAMQYQLFPRLKERRKQLGGTLSGGEQQMLAIARGMMADPLLLVLDEPTLGLAPIIVDEMFDLIIRIRDLGKTVLLIEQNATMALSLSDRAYVLERGEITLSGSGEDLLNDPKVQEAYLGI